MSKNFIIEQISKDSWQQIFEKNWELCFFSNPKYHCVIDINCNYYIIKKNNETVAFFFCPVSKNKEEVIDNEFLIYSGIYFKKNNLIDVKKNILKHKIIHFISEFLPKKFKKIDLTFNCQVLDIRPFIWFNYNIPQRKKYEINVKHTSILNIKNANNFENLEENCIYNNMETVRRYSIRQALKERARIITSGKIDNLIENYKSTLEKQNIEVSMNKLDKISKIYFFLKENNLGELFQVLNSKNKVLYNLLYCWRGNIAYFLFGAGDPGDKTSWKSTIGHWYIFNFLKKNSIDYIDMEGVNSPNRGWFKESFGGKLKQYYNIFFN